MFTKTNRSFQSEIAVDAEGSVCWDWGTVNNKNLLLSCFPHPPLLSGFTHSCFYNRHNSRLKTTRVCLQTMYITANITRCLYFNADGKGLKVAPVSANTTHARRHVGLFWSCDPLESEMVNVTCCYGCWPLGGSSVFHSLDCLFFSNGFVI